MITPVVGGAIQRTFSSSCIRVHVHSVFVRTHLRERLRPFASASIFVSVSMSFAYICKIDENNDKIFASASFFKFLDIYVSYCCVLAQCASMFSWICICDRLHTVYSCSWAWYIYIMIYINLLQSPFVFVLVQASHFLLLYLAVTCYFCTADSDQFQ